MEVGKKITINNTNSIWDGKQGTVEEINEDRGTCTIFVDFNPEEGKKVRQEFDLNTIEESLEESFKNKETGEIGDIEKDFHNGFVLFKSDSGKSQVALDDLEEIEDEIEKDVAVKIETTPSFDRDFNNLSNPKEAEWFLSEKNSNSLLILETLGLEETKRQGKAKKETISNNNKYKGGITVYSLFKGIGSGNQFRAYFYQENDTCIFVRCLLKKTNKNSTEEDKAIIDTINYALSNKSVDNK